MNLVVLFTFLVLFTGFFTLMSTFYYSTNVVLSMNLVVLFTFLVLFTGFFALMSTFYYSTNVYEFSSTIYFSTAFYWVLHINEYFLLFYECVFVVGRVYTIEPQVGSHKISIST